MANEEKNRAGEPNLVQMSKYTIALHDSFEQINDVLNRHEAGFINDKTAVTEIDEIVKKVIL